MAVNKSVVSSVVRSVVNPIISAIRRNFTTLTAAGSQHYTIPTNTVGVNSELEGEVYISSFTAGSVLVGGPVSDAQEYVIRTSGSGQLEVFFQTPGGFIGLFTTGATLELSKLNTFNVSVVGTALSVAINGVSEGFTMSGTISGVRAGRLGSRTNGGFLGGILANINFKSGWTNNSFYKIDEDWTGPSTVLHDSSGNNQHGVAVNIDSTDAELFTRFNNVSPNEFRNGDASVILEIAGT